MKRTPPATWVAATGMFLLIPVWCPAADQGSQANPNRIATHPPFHIMAQTTSPKAEQQQPIQEEVSRSAKTKKVALPTYNPPKDMGNPFRTQPAGTRGPGNPVPSIAVLAPNKHYGVTAQAQPTVYWFLEHPIDAPVEFTLMESDGISPLVETRLPAPIHPGVHKVSFADHDVHLVPDKKYWWYISLVMDPEHRSKDVVVGGGIIHQEQDAEMATKVSQTSEKDRLFLYAEAGLWYEAIDAASQLVEMVPTNEAYRTLRAALLHQISLDSLETRPTQVDTTGNTSG